MKILYTFLILLVCLDSNSQTIKHEYEISEVNKLGSASTKIMTRRIKEAAIRYKDKGSLPRFAKFDYSFGSDTAEFKALNATGVLYITSLNRDTNEYPVKRIYVKTADKELDLTSFYSTRLPVTDTLIKQVFSENRIDYYYFIPYYYTQLSGELIVDWSRNRTGFVLCKFPQKMDLGFITNENMHPDDKKEMNPKALKAFMEREYQITLTEK